ncbi:MAG: DUF2283 domain-containing protein [Thermoanaerobaculia bacterium]
MKAMKFSYDQEADVMYLSVGRPQKAKTVEIGRDFVLRLDPKTERVIGLTIVDFSKHFAAIGKKVPPKGNFNAERLLKQLWAATA